MATLDELPVKQLTDHLISGGFIDFGFTDIFGNAQPAPVFQQSELNLTRKNDATPNGVQANERIIMIRESGNVQTRDRLFMKRQPMIIVVVGQVGESDSLIAKGYAQDIEKYLLNNFSAECFSQIEIGGTIGPLITEDSRRVYEVNITVVFNV